MNTEHRLTVLHNQLNLRHPQNCTGEYCPVRQALKFAEGVGYFHAGLYTVQITGLNSVHLTQVRSAQESVLV